MSRLVALTGPVRWHLWGDNAVVYHRPSGSTHAMEAFGPAILACMQPDEASAGQAVSVEWLSQRLEATVGAGAAEALTPWLRQFEKLGLVEFREA